MKRSEFFKKLGLGIGALVVAPKILVELVMPKDAKTPFDTAIAELYPTTTPFLTLVQTNKEMNMTKHHYGMFEYALPWGSKYK